MSAPGAIPIASSAPGPAHGPAPLATTPPPPPQPKGLELETLARERLRHMVGLKVDIAAPTWNQILFSTKRIALRLEKPPAAVLAAIDQIPESLPPGAPPDAVDTDARLMLKTLSSAKPRPIPPRSLAGGKPLAPPADAVAKWMRRVWLVMTGPEGARLLTAAGYLYPGDVDVLEGVYPDGFDEERKSATAAAMALATAGARTRMEHDLPAWLNDQLLVLMDDRRPSDYFKEIYAQDAKEQAAKGPSPSSATPNLISQQMQPNPSVDR